VAAALQVQAPALVDAVQQVLDVVQDKDFVRKSHFSFLLVSVRGCLRLLLEQIVIVELDQVQDQTLQEESEDWKLQRKCASRQQGAKVADHNLQQELMLILVWSILKQSMGEELVHNLLSCFGYDFKTNLAIDSTVLQNVEH